MPHPPAHLKKVLGPFTLWGLGVGYVISGMYFGWNLGLPRGGSYGLLAATLVVTVLYATFILSYMELACAIPRAGGAFTYAQRALGARLGFLTGLAQFVEFAFAPPAIAAAIGAYFNLFFPSLSPVLIATIAYLIFTAINIYGVRASALFEFVITLLAIFEILLFCGITIPHFSWQAFSLNALPHGWHGAFIALPFAIWFYLGIEGLANVAEEASCPERDLPRSAMYAFLTLTVLALFTFFAAVGVGGWDAIVYPAGATHPVNSPLPLALAEVVGQNHSLYHLLIAIGLLGLIASLNGILLAGGRVIFELGRAGLAPRWAGYTLAQRQTPTPALLLNMIIGMIALYSGHTSELIIIAVFGALTLYIFAMLALFRLRAHEPHLPRPYRVPFYPYLPLCALILAVLCLVAMMDYNIILGLIYLGLLGIGFIWFEWIRPKTILHKESERV